MKDLKISERVKYLKKMTMNEFRYISLEQAKIITDIYIKNKDKPTIIKRAIALNTAMHKIRLKILPQELIVGNRTKGVRAGVVFPESGGEWVNKEIETLPTRAQDKFKVKKGDIKDFREKIKPFWRGKSLEDIINIRCGKEISEISKVVKINQTDHAQGHICPNCEKWLKLGPQGISNEAREKLEHAKGPQKDFYKSIMIVMEGAKSFIKRYNVKASKMAEEETNEELKQNLKKIEQVCGNIALNPPKTFHEAVQSIWFLFVLLHLESNASSFSPGRLDKILYPYYKADIDAKILTEQEALEIIECLYIKFNQIVYLRSKNSAKYFAGFPIGFNVALGGIDENGNDYVNELSYLFLKAQEHMLLPQPNLSVRLHKNTSYKFLKESIKVVAKGSGMPEFFNDEAIIKPFIEMGISEKDARDYAIVGCVELTTQGNNLGWSDAAMFNFNKALELTLTGGKCLLTGKKIGPDFGSLATYATYEQLESAYEKMCNYYIEKMVKICEEVEKAHIDILPSPFLSSVIDDCIKKGMDVTAGGAHYNFSGIQMIQAANLADSLAALKILVFENKKISAKGLLAALKNNFKGNEIMRQILLNHAPKYGNDIKEVDEIAIKWANYFKNKLLEYKNYRGGIYHTGMYTVSAHIPMGENVGASPDGRKAKEPLADGGMSPMYGRDKEGPTAVLKSVSKFDNKLTTNGGLLNMKFLPEFFKTDEGIEKFILFMRGFVDLKIPHIQFNVVRREDLIAAIKNPEKYRSLTVRVAGYTAYFTELAGELQNEIIARTNYGTSG